jgi:hypothetical protein
MTRKWGATYLGRGVLSIPLWDFLCRIGPY